MMKSSLRSDEIAARGGWISFHLQSRFHRRQPISSLRQQGFHSVKNYHKNYRNTGVKTFSWW